jgi:hypothetical protein
MAIARSSHGGDCCGINHVCRFYFSYPGRSGTTLTELRQKIRETTGSLVEVVLTKYQLEGNNYELEKLMKKAKFRLVSTFRNTNTGSQCYVFHYYKTYRRQKNDLPLILPSVEAALAAEQE